ncbi:hypothetical protein K402DRAFT_455502 [Aulographum hederae CBS 113979]|uniref:Uncharacterized protein n=1 Tax=Aulographum hederae CBS 113979 TaxID=1176131 RepID=A0A6G1GVC4_9PEZI|nr:hypothetical protein K402DRAFT_455502 [Aulographum hederae CBS 113979]
MDQSPRDSFSDSAFQSTPRHVSPSTSTRLQSARTLGGQLDEPVAVTESETSQASSSPLEKHTFDYVDYVDYIYEHVTSSSPPAASSQRADRPDAEPEILQPSSSPIEERIVDDIHQFVPSSPPVVSSQKADRLDVESEAPQASSSLLEKRIYDYIHQLVPSSSPPTTTLRERNRLDVAQATPSPHQTAAAHLSSSSSREVSSGNDEQTTPPWYTTPSPCAPHSAYDQPAPRSKRNFSRKPYTFTADRANPFAKRSCQAQARCVDAEGTNDQAKVVLPTTPTIVLRSPEGLISPPTQQFRENTDEKEILSTVPPTTEDANNDRAQLSPQTLRGSVSGRISPSCSTSKGYGSLSNLIAPSTPARVQCRIITSPISIPPCTFTPEDPPPQWGKSRPKSCSRPHIDRTVRRVPNGSIPIRSTIVSSCYTFPLTRKRSPRKERRIAENSSVIRKLFHPRPLPSIETWKKPDMSESRTVRSPAYWTKYSTCHCSHAQHQGQDRVNEENSRAIDHDYNSSVGAWTPWSLQLPLEKEPMAIVVPASSLRVYFMRADTPSQELSNMQRESQPNLHSRNSSRTGIDFLLNAALHLNRAPEPEQEHDHRDFPGNRLSVSQEPPRPPPPLLQPEPLAQPWHLGGLRTYTTARDQTAQSQIIPPDQNRLSRFPHAVYYDDPFRPTEVPMPGYRPSSSLNVPDPAASAVRLDPGMILPSTPQPHLSEPHSQDANSLLGTTGTWENWQQWNAEFDADVNGWLRGDYGRIAASGEQHDDMRPFTHQNGSVTADFPRLRSFQELNRGVGRSSGLHSSGQGGPNEETSFHGQPHQMGGALTAPSWTQQTEREEDRRNARFVERAPNGQETMPTLMELRIRIAELLPRWHRDAGTEDGDLLEEQIRDLRRKLIEREEEESRQAPRNLQLWQDRQIRPREMETQLHQHSRPSSQTSRLKGRDSPSYSSVRSNVLNRHLKQPPVSQYTHLAKRGRGRPRGSKNKPKNPPVSQYTHPAKRGRGRPPSSKNKPKNLPPPPPPHSKRRPKGLMVALNLPSRADTGRRRRIQQQRPEAEVEMENAAGPGRDTGLDDPSGADLDDREQGEWRDAWSDDDMGEGGSPGHEGGGR